MKIIGLILSFCYFSFALAQSNTKLHYVLDQDQTNIQTAILFNHQDVKFQKTSGGFLLDAHQKDSLRIYVPGSGVFEFSGDKYQSLQLYYSSQLHPLSHSQSQIFELAYQNSSQLNYSATTFERTKILSTDQTVPVFDLKKSSQIRVYKRQVKQEVNDLKLEGFEVVNQKMLSQDVFGFNVFTPQFELFRTSVFSPLGSRRHRVYNFYSVADTKHYLLIYFQSKSKQNSNYGYVLIDKSKPTVTYLQLYIGKVYDLNAQVRFDKTTGLPLEQELLIKPTNSGKKLSFFGGGINFGQLQTKTKSSRGSKELQFVRVFKESAILSQHQLEQTVNTSFNSDLPRLTDTSWETLAKAFLTEEQGLETNLSTYVEERNLYARIRRINAFEQGFLPISSFDVDLTRLVKVNNYEGFRLGLGLQTNNQFSKTFRLGAYTAYGTKDTSFKYGFASGYNFNSSTNTWLNVHYANDIKEVGTNAFLTDQRVYSVFEPRLVNITYFFKYESIGLSLQHNFTPQLLSELRLQKINIDQTRDYLFNTNEDSFTNYNLSTAKFSLRWMPNSKTIRLNKRTSLVQENTPSFSAQIEQSFANLLEGDLNFTRLSAKAKFDYLHSNGQQTEFSLEGNLGFGDIPITHTFHALPNSPNKDRIINRFSVAGVKSFETMYFNEFFNTRQATLHMKHKLNPFKISSLVQPQLVLISRHAIGGFSDIERHEFIEFNTLNHPFNEAAVELNNILYGFGLSFAYRYGTYHLPVFEDNISFKFTFYLKL